MTIRLAFISLLLLLSSLSPRGQAETTKKPSLNWLAFDFPPYEIADGPNKGDGVIDRLRKQISAATPQYTHKGPLLINQSRMDLLLQTGNYCHASAIPTPKLKKISYMSYTSGGAFPHTIIVTEDTYKKHFSNQDDISLEDLLKNQSLTLGVSSRSMGKVLDKIITTHAKQNNVHIRKGFSTSGKITQMLIKKRIDYTIEYPILTTNWNSLNPKLKLVPIPIRETAGDFIVGRVSCSRNSWGKTAIKNINDSLLLLRKEPRYLNHAFLAWMPKSLHEQFSKFYNSQILSDRWTNIND